MIISMFSYYFHLPTFYQIEACCESTVVRITRQRYDTLTAQSHDFARWALQMAHGQLFFFEMKNSVINGDAQGALSLAGEKPPRNHGKGAAEIRGFLSGNHAVVPEPAEKSGHEALKKSRF